MALNFESMKFLRNAMEPFDVIGLRPLMKRTRGRPEITVAVIDGPAALHHPDLVGQRIREIPGNAAGCDNRDSLACAHGTFVIGMLAAKRASVAPGICPDCSFLHRPIFSDSKLQPHGAIPTATPEDLAAAIIDAVQAGARVLNLSINLTGFSSTGETHLAEALSFAGSRGVIPVAAAANQGGIVGTTLTLHPWVIPVMACDRAGRPLQSSSFSPMVGKRGVSAPGEDITSLGTNGKLLTLSGTSAATAFVTGAIALLWSEWPKARAADVRFALTNASLRRRVALIPPILNAWSTYQALAGGATRTASLT
jgi:subtilisin family serine protease